MMTETRLKYILYFSAAIFLALLLIESREAGITCDEVLHYNQSLSVYNFFATHGTDQSALNTPVTHLKFYGQSYDNIVTILTRWFKIDDIYTFRHLMSSVAGWLAVLVTALFAAWLSGYGAGILTLLLFAVSPVFIGHSQNNLKDIPFALGYIAGTYYILKFLVSERKISISDVLLLTASIAFTMSIRAGGLVLICYLYFFFFVFYIFKYLRDKNVDFFEIRIKFFLITAITIISWLLSIILWPFALQSPVKNVLESYQVMAHFPDTFRQIFGGKVEWSDFMPWYYIPKSMAITIPLVVLTGLALFMIISRYLLKKEKTVLYGFVIFTILFPLVFVVYEKSNLYSSWRQFLFIYPAIVLLASVGFHFVLKKFKTKYSLWAIILLLMFLSFHPVKFMIKNHPYYYLYYNQLVGGLSGAYSNYETDYYYESQTAAAKWLIGYLEERHNPGIVKVKATYTVQWQFRNHPEIEASYFRYEERSLSDWDYSIVVNRYISPFHLRNKMWPPGNAIHTIYADNVPVCTVLERKSKDDYYGYIALKEGRFRDAVNFFEKVLKVDDMDEMFFYNLGAALYKDGQMRSADSILKRGLEINPDFEPILMYLGNIAKTQNKAGEAITYYERLIKANRKYFEAYVSLAELLADTEIMKARALLRTCLTMNPAYKPAIVALAETYRISDPDIARKYYELANSIKQ